MSSSAATRLALLVAAITGVLLVAGGARAAPREMTGAERLARTIQEDELKVRATKDPAERQRLTEEIERTKHELGPYDPSGTRVRCQASWHDATLEALDTEAKRLAPRVRSTSPAPLGLEAKLATRRMAAKCLERGWGWGSTLPKYQFDAFGQYLANNLPALDTVFDAVGATALKEEKSAAADPARKATADALAAARDAVALMGQAVNTFVTTDGKDAKGKQTMVASLGTFAEGLRSYCEAYTALQEPAGKAEKPDAPTPAAEGAKPAETAAVSLEDKMRLAKVRAIAETLADEEWEPVRKPLEQFAAAAEQGLRVPQARARATELLDHLALAADFLQEILQGKCASKEGTAWARKTLAEALAEMKDVGSRQYGYGMIRRLWNDEAVRRTLDASPLSPEAAKAVHEALSMREDVFKPLGKDYGSRWDEFNRGAQAIVEVLGRLREWPPKDLDERLAPFYAALSGNFLKACEAAGKVSPLDLENLHLAYAAAGNSGRDIERIVKADQAVKAVAKYVPTKAGSMTAELIREFQDIAGRFANTQQSARTRVDALIKPFAVLADFELPGPEHAATAARITGANPYKQALTTLNTQASAGVDAAIRGRPDALDKALEPNWMFRLLRHRCVADSNPYGKLDPGNLAPFSFPDGVWKAYVRALDVNLGRVFQQYASDRLARASQTTSLGGWDETYAAVAVAQRLTAASRRETDTERDVLLRNLERVADPSPPPEVWYGWAVGYHMTESATALAAGYESVAAWHRRVLAEIRSDHPGSDRSLSRTFAPGELEAPLPAAGKK